MHVYAVAHHRHAAADPQQCHALPKHLIALLCQSLSSPCPCFASPCIAEAIHRESPLCLAVAGLYYVLSPQLLFALPLPLIAPSLLRRALLRLCYSFPCRHDSALCHAKALLCQRPSLPSLSRSDLCFTLLCPSVAQLHTSMPSPRRASPRLCVSTQFRANPQPKLICALPQLYIAYPRLSFSGHCPCPSSHIPGCASPCLAFGLPLFSMPKPCPAKQCQSVSLPCYAISCPRFASAMPVNAFRSNA